MTAVALVLKFGLVGVAVGTLVAMVYRTCYLAWYISRNVINRSLWAFAKHLCVDACSIALFVGLVYNVLGPIQELHATTYFGWSIYKETVSNFNQKCQIYRFYPRKKQGRGRLELFGISEQHPKSPGHFRDV